MEDRQSGDEETSLGSVGLLKDDLEQRCKRGPVELLWAGRSKSGGPDLNLRGWNESKILLDQLASMTENGLVVVDGPGRRRRKDHLRKFLAMPLQVTDRPCESGDVIRGSQPSPVAA